MLVIGPPIPEPFKMLNSLPKNDVPAACEKALCVNWSYSISVVAPVGRLPTSDPAPVLIFTVNRVPDVSDPYIVVEQSTGVGVNVAVEVAVNVDVGVLVGVVVDVAVTVFVGVGVFVGVKPAGYCTRTRVFVPRDR